jgi:hypothetical protein
MNADIKLLCPVYKGREISSGGVGFREWGGPYRFSPADAELQKA